MITESDWVAEIDALYEKATKEATTGDSLMFNNIVMPNDAITELKWKLVKDWPKIRQSILRPGCLSDTRITEIAVEAEKMCSGHARWDDFERAIRKSMLSASGESKK